MTTLSISMAAGTDDGQSGTGSGYSTGSGSIQLGGYFGTANGWYRGTNVTIAPTASISDFRLNGNKNSSAGTADLIFNFVKEANPTYPTSGSDYDGRTLTTANVTASYSGTGAFTSANCATPAQEIIDQGGWASGNAQIFYARDNNSNANHGGFENRIGLQAFDGGSNIPTLDWTYSSPISAPVVVGTVALSAVAVATRKNAPVVVGSVTFTGVTPTVPTAIQAAVVPGTVTFAGVSLGTRKSAASPIGTVTIAGVSPTATHRAAVTAGTVTFTGVALTSIHYAAVLVGAVTLTGVAPTAQHRAATPIGAVTFAGVVPSARHSVSLPVGEFMLTPINEIQEVRYNEAGDGWQVELEFQGTPIVFTTGASEEDLQNLFVVIDGAIVTRYSDGFTVQFAGASGGTNQPELTITNDPSGSVTIHTVRHGMTGNTITVRKGAGVAVGAVAISGVVPATRKSAAVVVGSVVFAGVTPLAVYGFPAPGLEFTALGRLHWTIDTHHLDYTAQHRLHYTAPDEDT